MLDFPASPTNGQTFTSGGTIWMYDGAKWVGGSSSATGLAPLASPAFTGNPTGPTPPAGDNDTSLATTAFVAPAFNDVGRNLIHNPLFNVQQRGVGPWTTTGYNFDRWFLAFAGSSTTITRVPQSDGGRAAIGDEACTVIAVASVTGTAGAGDYSQLLQPVEGILRLSGKTVTISFWAAGGTAGLKVGVSCDQLFGTGGSPSASVNVNGQSVTLTTGWARYSVTLNIPSAAGKTFGTNGDDRTQFDFWFSAGSSFASRSGGVGVQSGNFNLWGVQLEIGTVATPLEKPDPQQDLARCQRFFCVGNVALTTYSTAGQAIGVSANFPVTMRATPTLTYTTNINVNVGGVTGVVESLSGAFFYATATATGQPTQIRGTYTASADL